MRTGGGEGSWGEGGAEVAESNLLNSTSFAEI